MIPPYTDINGLAGFVIRMHYDINNLEHMLLRSGFDKAILTQVKDEYLQFHNLASTAADMVAYLVNYEDHLNTLYVLYK